jgi:23S rRNA (adenine2503-C2)-methyltransferase
MATSAAKMTADKVNLLGLDREGLERFCAELGEKPFRARQLLQWIHQRGIADFDQMTDLSKAFRAKLAAVAEVRAPEVMADQPSGDGTRKWLLRMDATNGIEAVYIPDDERGTLCISTQVGCALDCSFCSTGKQGFNRDLTTAEIVGQVWHAARALGQFDGACDPADRRITNIVLMGMGEPLMNYERVLPALRLFMDDLGYGLSKRKVTLSTSGVVPGIDRLTADVDVALALSLHAPNDELRDRLVPLNRKWPIAEVIAACRRYVDARPHRHVLIEYVMLDGINDTDQHARELVRICSQLPIKVNLIPFNPFPGSGYRRSDEARIAAFRAILQGKGIITTTRRTRGEDIDAACGQLAGQVADRGTKQARYARRRAAGGEG